MISAEDVVALFNTRRRERGAHIARMVEVQKMYDGDIWIPLPELDENERPAVANLLLQGVNQLGMRLSSVLPDVNFEPLKPGDDDSMQKAHDRRKAEQGWEDMNQLAKKEGRRSRFLVAYGSGPVMVKPVGTGAYHKREMPYWHVINPLAVYPAQTSDPDDIEPMNVIIQRHVTLGWLRKAYPQQAAMIYKGKPDRNGYYPPETKFDLLEYNDEIETVLIVCGAALGRYQYGDFQNGSMPYAVLERTENRAGMCLAVVPGQITISRLMGNFDQIIGMFLAQAKMTAYENIAVRQGIFPEKWVVSHPNAPSSARIVALADGKEGEIGEIENGTILTINTQPGQMASQAIDRLERNQRVQASIPSDWGGESATNIRTAKRGEQISSSAVDPTLGELQSIIAESRVHEIERAIAVEKGWYGKKWTSFYIPRSGEVVTKNYVPDALFESDFCRVKFSMPGVDQASIPIELGQRTQTGMISMKTARGMDPLVEDAEFEDKQVALEGMRMAILKALEAQLSQGGLDLHEVAYMAKLQNAGDKQLEEVVLEAQEWFQNQQAANAAQQPGAAAVQPGLAQQPPPGAPAPGGGGQPPLAQILAQMRQPTQQSAAEQSLGQPAGGQ